MAAYPNAYQGTYQPMYYQNYQPAYQNQQIQQPAQTNSNLIWVQGEAGAKSYLVAPNNTVQLWDSERQTIYLKSADASGMPSMKVIDYTVREDVPQTPNFVTHDEMEKFCIKHNRFMISDCEGKEVAKRIGASLILPVSSLKGQNVRKVFIEAARAVLNPLAKKA